MPTLTHLLHRRGKESRQAGGGSRVPLKQPVGRSKRSPLKTALKFPDPLQITPTSKKLVGSRLPNSAGQETGSHRLPGKRVKTFVDVIRDEMDVALRQTGVLALQQSARHGTLRGLSARNPWALVESEHSRMAWSRLAKTDPQAQYMREARSAASHQGRSRSRHSPVWVSTR